MDVQRFLGLYVSETHEHVRLLHGSLLAIEARSDGAAVDEAFRAAHTLKGLSAAMSFTTVADLAHALEDRLTEVRAGLVTPAPALIDEMLALADRIEAAIAQAVAAHGEGEPAHVAATASAAMALGAAGAVGVVGVVGAVGGDVQAPGRGGSTVDIAAPGVPQAAGAADALVLPAGAVRVAVVRLRQDAPLKPVRAMLIMRALEGVTGVIGSEPSEFGDAFEGEFRIYLTGAADVAATRAAVIGAGEVETVEVLEGSAVAAVASPRDAGAHAHAPRQLRVDVDRLDVLADDIGELTLMLGRLQPATGLPPDAADTIDRVASAVDRLQHDLMRLRMVPLRQAFERLPRVVRDAARALDRDVELVVAGDDVEVDRAIVDEIADPLVHLLRNAVGHGIEPAEERIAAGKPTRGRIDVRAERERSSVRIVVSDDGRGVRIERVIERALAAGLIEPADARALGDEALLRLLSRPGMSTAEAVSGVSGRGVGMDVVVSRVRGMGGAIDMRSEAGAGTTFSIRLPISLALTPALRVRVGGEDYAIPLTHISEAVELHDAEAAAVHVRGEPVPLVRLGALLRIDGGAGARAAVIAGTGFRRAALAVDELVGREQILVKGFDAATGTLPYFSGATLLADGRPALVLDPLSVIPG
jgi:two-component system, chemotaxis family, sensor kinase CheA